MNARSPSNSERREAAGKHGLRVFHHSNCTILEVNSAEFTNQSEQDVSFASLNQSIESARSQRPAVNPVTSTNGQNTHLDGLDEARKRSM